MKLQSACFLGLIGCALVRCSVYEDDALTSDGEGGRSGSSKTVSAASGQGGDAGATTQASSSAQEGSSAAPSTTTTEAATTTADATATATTDASSSSQAASSSSTGMVVGTAWINELHYDNASLDQDEGVEIAGTAGLDLTGWQLVAYNGSNGTVSGSAGGTVTLAGTLPNQMGGKGTKWFPVILENGPTDGVALIDAGGQVVQFLAWEGAFTGTAGPAAGAMAIDIGVSQTSDPLGTSLQLTGTGDAYADFTWVGGVASSHDAVNAGQTLQ